MIGIYKIYCKTSGHCYIGSSLNIRARWQRHRHDLNVRKKHHSIILQRAWEKYGEEDFEFSVLEECSIENMLQREQHYLNELLPVYNICRIAGNCTGVKNSEETKQKKREVAILMGLRPPVRAFKPVTAIKDNGDTIHFESMLAAVDFLGKSRDFVSSISRAIRRNIKAYGYKWQYS